MIKQSQFFIIVFCVLFTSFSFAQEKKEGGAPTNKLQFYLINGLDIAYTDLSSGFPIRYAISITGAIGKSSGDDKQQNFYSNDTSESKSNYDRKSFNYRISPQFHYMVSLYDAEYFKTYMGVGPTFFFQRNYSNTTNRYEQSTSSEVSKRESNYWTNYYGIGLSSLFGLESKLTDHLSLFAEYNLNYTYQWNDGKRDSKRNSSSRKGNNNSTSHYLTLSSVRLGASIYF